jgi:hypothetical protein
MLRCIVAAALAGAALTSLAACSATPATSAGPASRAVSGHMNLQGAAFDFAARELAGIALEPGDHCESVGGYTDIAAGAEVDVLDSAGKVLGIGNLQTPAIGDDAESCSYAFTVAAVPAGQKIYGVRVGNTARGVVHFTEAQLFDGPELTLGG